MSTEHKASEPNALAERLGSFWTSFKQGKIIGYKWMAIILIVVSVIGVGWYITSERRTARSLRWMEEEGANTQKLQEEISTKYPGTIQDRLARLQIARYLLGEKGIEQMTATDAKERNEAVANVEKAREMFQKLVEDFKDDRVFKVQCVVALAKAEAALCAVPANAGLTEFKGKLPTVVEYLDKVSAEAGSTAWGEDAKKLADALRNEQSPSADTFRRVQRDLFNLQTGATDLKINEPQAPILPGFPSAPTITGIPGK